MEQRIFVLTSLLEDRNTLPGTAFANALPIGYIDVFDTKGNLVKFSRSKSMNNWRESLLEHGDETIKIAEESFDDDDRDQVEEHIREWTMEWDSPTYELHFSQVIHEFVKIDGKFIKVSHA